MCQPQVSVCQVKRVLYRWCHVLTYVFFYNQLAGIACMTCITLLKLEANKFYQCTCFGQRVSGYDFPYAFIGYSKDKNKKD